MELEQYIEYIKEAFSENGYGDLIDDNKAETFYKLSSLLIETNKVTNLTAITNEEDVIFKHFLDSATVCRHIPDGARIIDVGCGAGFPSLPIAIIRNDVEITSLDSTGKKINFVNSAADHLGLHNVTGICARAEDFVSKARESYDICTGRAVSRLNVLSEICIPFVKIGGSFVAMKSSKGEDEYTEAKNGIEKLGCKYSSSESIELITNGEPLHREIYVFKKEASTPKIYPRNYSQITKKPL